MKLLHHSEITGELYYLVEIEHYRGPKKPKIPAAKGKKSVPTLKFLASMDISLSRAQGTDFALSQDVITAEKCREFNEYYTEKCRETGQYVNARTNALYLPLIDMTPSDPDSIMTAMYRAKSLTIKYGQDFTVFTGDLQIYTVAANIVREYPDQFDDAVLQLGGMHTLISFFGCIGILMAASGLQEIMESTFGGF